MKTGAPPELDKVELTIEATPERHPDARPARDPRFLVEPIKGGLLLSNKAHHLTLLSSLIELDHSPVPIQAGAAGIEAGVAAGRSKIGVMIPTTPGDAVTTICFLFFPYVD